VDGSRFSCASHRESPGNSALPSDSVTVVVPPLGDIESGGGTEEEWEVVSMMESGLVWRSESASANVSLEELPKRI
jgi:hypothetical protein